MNKYMNLALEEEIEGIQNNHGGPFGAVIVKDNQIVSKGHNEVLKEKDPTCHAEIIAIRNACKKLNTLDLKGCTLYTTCEPCPMCLSAIIWANIDNVFYACTKNDATEIGFRDEMIYDFIKGKNKDLLNLKQIDRDDCIEHFLSYKGDNY